MVTSIGDKVHPWYKGNHEWKVNDIVQLKQPIKYHDAQQGDVEYNPRILKLEAPAGCTVLWFAYWMSTDKALHKMRWGGGPPILEESVFLELMKKAIGKGVFSKDFLIALDKEIKNSPGS
jgi:hypothetical protein